MIPVCEPVIGNREKELVNQCLDTGWISAEGQFVKDFEERFSSIVQCQYGIAVSNGTAALEVALYSIGITEGDEVIIPSFTIISCALAVVRLGGVPVYVDIDPETWCMDTNLIEAKITPRTRAIMAVHMYGHPAEMNPIMEIAKRNNLKVIEDCSQVHGAEYYGQKCGSIGDVATFSFYSNKLITTGEGGMVTTNSAEIQAAAQWYKNLCFDKERRYEHAELGYNFRLTNMQAAVGLGQIERLSEIIETKRKIGIWYREKILALDAGIQIQIEKPGSMMVYWMYCIQLDPKRGANAAKVIGRMQELGVQCRHFFKGMHVQPALKKFHESQLNESYPVTELATEFGLYLPSSISLTRDTVASVVTSLEKAIRV